MTDILPDERSYSVAGSTATFFLPFDVEVARELSSPCMASKQACAKYQYVVTSSGPKILPVEEPYCKDEESPAEYNTGQFFAFRLQPVPNFLLTQVATSQ